MRRTQQEMLERFREVIASQSDDEIASYLEDITDSMADVDLTGYVPREEYEAVVAERDAANELTKDYRDRYINRFYEPGNNTNDITIIQSGAKQLEIEKEEKLTSYDDLFE